MIIGSPLLLKEGKVVEIRCQLCKNSNQPTCQVAAILRGGATLGELCTEPKLKVLLRCFLLTDREVLNQVSRLFLGIFSSLKLNPYR